jgi:hypothetical protein
LYVTVWNRLAAVVDAFRSRYRVEEATPEAIPNQYQERAVGAELQQRVTAMHKSAALTTEPPADQAARARVAEQATAAAQRAREAAQRGPQSAAEALRARNQAEAERAAAQLRRAGRTPAVHDSAGSTTRDAAEVERQRQERARGNDARER